MIVISDEIYAELLMRESTEHCFISRYAGRTIFLHGFSKAFAMTGLGLICLRADWLIDAMMKIHQYCMMCAPFLVRKQRLKLCGMELKMFYA